MTEGCGLCGGQLDDHAVRVTVTFAAGLRNGNQWLEVPYRLEDWPLCWKCFEGAEGCKVLRSALADEYIEPVIPGHGGCRAVCAGTFSHLKGKRLRRLFSVRQGQVGLPDAGKCPVCWGPCEVERAA